MRKYVIIVAGGKGLRMGSDIPKQFILVAGRPLLMRTLDTFLAYDQDLSILLALPREQMDYWFSLCEKYATDYASRVTVVAGGETRFHSVQNALACVPEGADSLVAVHDGVRPFVSKETIAAAFDEAALSGCAVPVADAVDSIREVTEGGSIVRDRSKIKLVQTPQVFRSSLLKEAYHQVYCDAFTDDASVVEAAGYKVVLTPGNRENIKITTPFDLKVAEALVKS
ncbi:MAG: 2-C-methyl-D-erythritol 4-phosphate cytidylyltransferase [Paludibacteraceae bacterium]|nr:2-C-methyl-D-erythritol 4-phosphate cytidylyltransferase [Paludibacteraceae bacterium]